jgi:Ca-activated chloride channel homolog
LSFQAPLFFLLLLAAPVLVGLYLRHERKARHGRGAFASPKLLPSVAPALPRVRRHLPMAMYLLGMVALVVALARPERTVTVDVDQARILLVTDQSGSMAAQDVAPTRLDAARRAATQFVDDVPRRVQVGSIVYNQGARVLAAPTTDRAAVRQALASITPAGSTATGDALQLALNVATQAPEGAEPPPAAIILLSDGESVRGREPVPVAEEAGKQKVPIYTVSLGTAEGTIPKRNRDGTTGTQTVPPDPQTLRQIAEVSGGETFDVSSSGELSRVYEQLGSQLTQTEEQRQITWIFAAGGLALLVIGGLMSLLWFGRLP